jgi:hypothetical protein
VQDNVPGLYIISDDEIQYLLDKNSNNVNRAAVEAARVILFNLSMRNDSVVDIFSIKSSSSAKAYIEALKLFIRDPSLSGVLSNINGYAGGISISDMQENDANLDNNIPVPPSKSPEDYSIPSNTFFTI